MTQRINASITNVNMDLLAQQLSSAASTYAGLIKDVNGLGILFTDVATQTDINTALSVVAAHDSNGETATQTATRIGKSNIVTLLSTADIAIADLTAKRAAAVATPNITTVGALVLSITDNLIAVIKCLKFILVNYN